MNGLDYVYIYNDWSRFCIFCVIVSALNKVVDQPVNVYHLETITSHLFCLVACLTTYFYFGLVSLELFCFTCLTIIFNYLFVSLIVSIIFLFSL